MLFFFSFVFYLLAFCVLFIGQHKPHLHFTTLFITPENQYIYVEMFYIKKFLYRKIGDFNKLTSSDIFQKTKYLIMKKCIRSNILEVTNKLLIFHSYVLANTRIAKNRNKYSSLYDHMFGQYPIDHGTHPASRSKTKPQNWNEILRSPDCPLSHQDTTGWNFKNSGSGGQWRRPTTVKSWER